MNKLIFDYITKKVLDKFPNVLICTWLYEEFGICIRANASEALRIIVIIEDDCYHISEQIYVQHQHNGYERSLYVRSLLSPYRSTQHGSGSLSNPDSISEILKIIYRLLYEQVNT